MAGLVPSTTKIDTIVLPNQLPGLILWFRSDLGVTTSSGTITQWLDQSSSGIVLNSTVGAASFPTYNTSGGPNNLPYLSFTGTQFIGFNSGQTLPNPLNMTVFSVLQFNPASQLSYVFYNNTASVATFLDGSGARTFRNGTGVDVIGSTQTGNWEQWTGTLTNGAQVFRVNGTQVGTSSTAYASPVAGATIAGFGGGTTAHPLTGGVVEYICFNRVLSAYEIQIMEDYLRQRTGLFFAPQISGLAGWWRSDKLITLNSTTVSSWGDLSGFGGTVSQATGANQPTYSTSGGVNNLPKLTFSGSTQILENTTQNVMPAGTSRTVFVVGQPSTSAGGGCPIGFKITAPACILLYQVIASNIYVFTDGSAQSFTFSSGSTISTAPQILEYTWVLSAQPTFSINTVGKTITTANVANSDTGTTGFSIGKRADTAGSVFVGDLYEIIVYNRLLTAAETTSVQNYLRARYLNY